MAPVQVVTTGSPPEASRVSTRLVTSTPAPVWRTWAMRALVRSDSPARIARWKRESCSTWIAPRGTSAARPIAARYAAPLTTGHSSDTQNAGCPTMPPARRSSK